MFGSCFRTLAVILFQIDILFDFFFFFFFFFFLYISFFLSVLFYASFFYYYLCIFLHLTKTICEPKALVFHCFLFFFFFLSSFFPFFSLSIFVCCFLFLFCSSFFFRRIGEYISLDLFYQFCQPHQHLFTHSSEEKNVFFRIHEITRVLVLYNSL